MPLDKQQLIQENNTNFPNNNTQFITPALLRQFNADMIDSMQLTQSMSEYAKLNAANQFTGNQTITGNLNVTGVISASVLYVQTEKTPGRGHRQAQRALVVRRHEGAIHWQSKRPLASGPSIVIWLGCIERLAA